MKPWVLPLTGLLLLGIFLFMPIFPLRFSAVFLLLLLVLSRSYSEYLARHLIVIRRDRELREFRYRWIGVEIMLENRGRLPAFMITLKDYPGMLPVARGNKLLCSLRGRSRVVLNWKGHCSERGVFELGPALVRTADPLGFFPIEINPGGKTKLFVYPAAMRFAETSPGGLPLGSLITPNPLYEDLTRRRSIRDYRSGDEMRRINWKLSARMSRSASSLSRPEFKLLVNEYEATKTYPIMVFLNLDPREYPLNKRNAFMERSIEAAAAFCLLASRERQTLGIIIYTPLEAEPIQVVDPSAFSLIPIMERLAALRRTDGERPGPHRNESRPGNEAGSISGGARMMFEQGRRLPYGARFLYAGPDLGLAAYTMLGSLRASRISLEYLIIDEKTLSKQAASAASGGARLYSMKESGHELV